MSSSERRALILLIALLLGASALDYGLARHPGWFKRLLGEERLGDLMAAGRHAPTVPAGAAVSPPNASPDERAQPESPNDRKLPYDEEGRLDLNRADSTDLVLLKGVGPVLAGRILQERRLLGGFRTRGQLLRVRGIGPKTLAKLLPQFTLGVVRDSLPAADADR